MSVEIEPTELAFTRPFTTEVSQSLKIRNSNRTPVAFKVKTTAPKQYCVRPNSGRIEPGKEVEVTVLLQAMKQDPPLDIKCRDKFLVQSVAVTADKEFTNIQSIVGIADLICRKYLLTGHSGSMSMRPRSQVCKRRRSGLSTSLQEVVQLLLHP